MSTPKSVVRKLNVKPKAIEDAIKINDKGKDEDVATPEEEVTPKEEEEEEGREYSRWHELPDLILERIFSYLNIRERFAASTVCWAWNDIFYMPYVWSTFIMDDYTLTRRKFNYYMGWQHVLDHMRTQNCLATIGKNIKTVVFQPMFSFYNFYEFMVMLSYYIERTEREKEGKVIIYKGHKMSTHPSELMNVRGGGQGIGSKISTIRFTFPCNMSNTTRTEDEYVFGTGGRLLEAFKRLMGNVGGTLRHLQLVDLLLEPREAVHLLDEVCCSGCATLETLELINVTKVPCTLIHPGVFVNLQVLVLSPQTLGVDLLQLLGSCSNLRHLHLLQNRYTCENLSSAPWKSWRQCRIDNPHLSVHLEVQSIKEGDVVWQQSAPVRSILYKSPYLKVMSHSVLTAIDQYRMDLEVYGHMGLPRFFRSKTFHERVDSLLLLLCRQCPNLHTLVIRERISTSTILLLAHCGQNLRYLHIRRNAVILRCDWPRSPDWSEVFYSWLKTASRSYEATEREVSQILGYPWTMMTDRQFKLTTVNLHKSPLHRAVQRTSYHTYVPPPPLPTQPPPSQPAMNPPQKREKKKKVRAKTVPKVKRM